MSPFTRVQVCACGRPPLVQTAYQEAAESICSRPSLAQRVAAQMTRLGDQNVEEKSSELGGLFLLV